MVFGNYIASDISKLSKILWYLEIITWYLENFEILRAGIIAKYYVCYVMLLFVYNRSREILGNAEETFLFTVEKTNTGIYVRNNIFRSMEEMIDSFFVKSVQTIQGKQHETVQ